MVFQSIEFMIGLLVCYMINLITGGAGFSEATCAKDFLSKEKKSFVWIISSPGENQALSICLVIQNSN